MQPSCVGAYCLLAAENAASLLLVTLAEILFTFSCYDEEIEFQRGSPHDLRSNSSQEPGAKTEPFCALCC